MACLSAESLGLLLKDLKLSKRSKAFFKPFWVSLLLVLLSIY